MGEAPHAAGREVELVEVGGLLQHRLEVRGLEDRQHQQVVEVGGQPEVATERRERVEEAGAVAARHEDHALHVGGEDRLLVPGGLVGELAHLAALRRQPAEEELGVHRRPPRLGVEEAAAVGRPPLRLVPVPVRGPDDSLVRQVRRMHAVVDEVGHAHVPATLAVVVDEVPVQVRPDELLPVRRPVRVVVVLALARAVRSIQPGELHLVRPVRPHHPQLRAEAAVARRADRDVVTVPRVEQHPVALRPRSGHIVRRLHLAREALAARAVLVRHVHLRAVALLEVLSEQHAAVGQEHGRLPECVRVRGDGVGSARVVRCRLSGDGRGSDRDDDGRSESECVPCASCHPQRNEEAGTKLAAAARAMTRRC